jgi:hypothetical protein
MWFEDLTPCTYFDAEHSNVLRAIGWLERGRSFETGDTDRQTVERLKEFQADPWQPCQFRGVHQCDICTKRNGRYEYGSKNLFIPGNRFIFVCPEMIVHYIRDHQYRPPDEFCDAVDRCPDMRSMAYKNAIMANGGVQLCSSKRMAYSDWNRWIPPEAQV